MKLTFAILMVFFLGLHIEADLQAGFYKEKCSLAEFIIKNEVLKAYVIDRGIAPGLLRAHFHDCFVNGCDGSVLIDSTPTNSAEKDGPPNGITLRGLQVIDNAKAKLEATCKGVVSCADILAFAARDSVVLTGGLYWDVPAGRRDSRISTAADTVQIPGPTFNLEQITKSFESKGLSQDDMNALLGAHTIGSSHCTSFSNRLYNFNTTTSQDPGLNPGYAQFLKEQCPRDAQGNVNQNGVVFMNQSPYIFDSSYYANLFQHKGLFTSDQVLLDSEDTANDAAKYAAHNLEWLQDFTKAMINMSKIGVKTGNEGEIRANCRVINP